MEDRPSDMYQDMQKLNMLYEEMCWDTEDIIEFYPDYDSNTIIIRNYISIIFLFFDFESNLAKYYLLFAIALKCTN